MIKVYRLNEYDFYAGESLEACVADYMKEEGLSREDAVDEYAGELTDKEMKWFRMKDEGDGIEKTLEEELSALIKNGTKFPCLVFELED